MAAAESVYKRTGRDEEVWVQMSWKTANDLTTDSRPGHKKKSESVAT